MREVISVIIPCYNEEESIPILYEALTRAAKDMPDLAFEYLFVDDGSRDGTLRVVRALAESDQAVRYLSFSRNFGKEAAMFAGMEEATGDYVAIIDADMQDPPDLLPKLYEIVAHEGYDCAAVRRVDREGEPKIRSLFARTFYRLMGKLCKIDVVDGARDFRLMTRRMTDSVLSLPEVNRYSKGIFSWVGYQTKWVESLNRKRVKGETKWSFFDLLLYAVDAMVSFSTKPLAISSVLGIGLFLFSLLAIVFVIVRQAIWGGSAYGWSSMVCIILLLSGLELFCIGILGQYLAKTFTEVKRRPIYIIKEKGGTEGTCEK